FQYVPDLVGLHTHDLGYVLGAGVVPQLLKQLAGDADDLVYGLDHVHRYAYGSRLVSYSAGDGLAYPPGRVGRELVALGVVELLDGLDEAEVALLDEVEKQHAAADIALRYRDDKAQVGLGHALLGLL